MTTNPVCGMTVDSAKARGGSFEHAGTTYYFCSPGCARSSRPTPTAGSRAAPGHGAPTTSERPTHNSRVRDTGTARGRGTQGPDKGTRDPDGPRTLDPEHGTQWTCPMHPEVACGQVRAGFVPSAAWRSSHDDDHCHAIENRSSSDMTRRFWVAAALIAAAAPPRRWAACAGLDVAPRVRCPHGRGSNLPSRRQSCLWAGWPFLVRGRSIGSDVESQHVHADRVSASSSRTVESVVAVLAPGLFPASIAMRWASCRCTSRRPR